MKTLFLKISRPNMSTDSTRTSYTSLLIRLSTLGRKMGISLFVLVECLDCSYDGALYEVNFPEAGAKSGLPVLDPVVTFFDKSLELPEYCLFVGARLDISKFYLIANGNPWAYNKKKNPLTIPPKFFFLDTVDSKLMASLELQHCIPSPKAAKPVSVLISAYGILYHLACPSCKLEIPPKPSFECYDPATNSWRDLPPCLCKTMPGPGMEILGFAVCYGYILISFYNFKDDSAMAFHIRTQKWHPVQVCESKDAYPFRGRAVVVGGMIYAISWRQNQVIAFSFSRDSDGNCFLGPATSLYVMNTPRPPNRFYGRKTNWLVHLGGNFFCLIETGENEYSNEHQYMCVTKFQILGEGGARVVRTFDSCVYQANIKGGYFKIKFAFTPDKKDVEPEERDCPIVSTETKSSLTLEVTKSKGEGKCNVGEPSKIRTGRIEDFIPVAK